MQNPPLSHQDFSIVYDDSDVQDSPDWVDRSVEQLFKMKTLIVGTLICVTVHLNSGRLTAQGGQGYFGVIGGISTLSGDGRSVTTPDRSAVSLYNPMNGPTLDIFGGWALNNYVSFQGNYIWNRNRLTLTLTEAFADRATFLEQERTSSHNSVFGDFLLYFRARRERIRPYLSTGVGLVRFKSTEDRNLVAVGAVEMPPASFRETTTVLRSAVGIDVRVGRGWAVRYSFSEFIGPNPIGRRLNPVGERSLMNFQNLVGFVRYF